MNHEEKINYMRIASGIVGFHFSNDQLDLLVSLHELIIDKKGKAAIDDIVHVEFEVKDRTEKQKAKEIHDALEQAGRDYAERKSK